MALKDIWIDRVDDVDEESLLDNNVWSPDVYPNGWEKLDGIPDGWEIVL